MVTLVIVTEALHGQVNRILSTVSMVIVQKLCAIIATGIHSERRAPQSHDQNQRLALKWRNTLSQLARPKHKWYSWITGDTTGCKETKLHEKWWDLMTSQIFPVRSLPEEKIWRKRNHSSATRKLGSQEEVLEAQQANSYYKKTHGSNLFGWRHVPPQSHEKFSNFVTYGSNSGTACKTWDQNHFGQKSVQARLKKTYARAQTN